jgi:hypothetical protein
MLLKMTDHMTCDIEVPADLMARNNQPLLARESGGIGGYCGGLQHGLTFFGGPQYCSLKSTSPMTSAFLLERTGNFLDTEADKNNASSLRRWQAVRSAAFPGLIRKLHKQ